MRRIAAALGVAFGAGALALAPAVAASAHDYLVSSTPKAGSTVSTELSTVTLTFDDRVLDLSGDGSSNVVEVTGPAGRHFENGCPTIADTDVTVPVALGASGDYTVRWQIVSADGHTVSSSLAFTYAKPASATAASGADSRPTCGDQAPEAPAASSGSSAPADSDTSTAQATSEGSDNLPLALGVGGGVILAALVAVVVVLTRARRGSGSQPPPAE